MSKAVVTKGDKLVLNVAGSVLMISKKNAKIFDKFDKFLPERFDKTLQSIRSCQK